MKEQEIKELYVNLGSDHKALMKVLCPKDENVRAHLWDTGIYKFPGLIVVVGVGGPEFYRSTELPEVEHPRDWDWDTLVHVCNYIMENNQGSSYRMASLLLHSDAERVVQLSDLYEASLECWKARMERSKKPFDPLSEAQKAAATHAYLDLQGSLEQHEEGEDCGRDWEAHKRSIQEMARAFPFLMKWKIQIPTICGWADQKVSEADGPFTVELFDTKEEAELELQTLINSELEDFEGRVVDEFTPADDDLYVDD